MVVVVGMDLNLAISDSLHRIGRNGLFVLAMMFSIACGAGLNFGLPIGMVCGLLGGILSMEFGLRGFTGLFTAFAIAVPLAITAGYLYGKSLNKVRGSEMMVGNYLAFSIVSLFSIVWFFFPSKNPRIVLPLIGYGVRPTVTIDDYYSKVLDDFLAIRINEDLVIPTGLFLLFIFGCVWAHFFFKTKTGISMECCGTNSRFAEMI